MERTTTEQIFTRIGFCPHCFRAHRPFTNCLYLVHGSTNGYKVQKAYKNEMAKHGNFGFVPFLYKIAGKDAHGNLIVHRCCCMYTCGIDREKGVDSYGYQYWRYFPVRWETVTYPVERWNGLIFWHPPDPDYEI